MTNPVSVVLVGAKGAGKTALVRSLQGLPFDDFIPPTIGAQYFRIDEAGEAPLEIWDLAGNEQFRNLRPLYYKNAKIIIFTLDKSTGFSEQAEQLAALKEEKQMIQRTAKQPPLFLVVTTKNDVVQEGSAVIPDERLRGELGVDVIVHASAKTGQGVEQVKQAVRGQLEQQHHHHVLQTIQARSGSLLERYIEACEAYLTNLTKITGLADKPLGENKKMLVELTGLLTKQELSPESRLKKFENAYLSCKLQLIQNIEKTTFGHVAGMDFVASIATLQLQAHCNKFLSLLIHAIEHPSTRLPAKILKHDQDLLRKKREIVEELQVILNSSDKTNAGRLSEFKACFLKNIDTLSQKTYKDKITYGFLIGISVITLGLGALAIAVGTYIATDRKRFSFWEPKEERMAKDMHEEAKTQAQEFGVKPREV